MRFAFILASMVAFPVTVMCRVLGVSRSGFYDWKAHPVTNREARDVALTARVRAVFVASRRAYGSPRVRAELRANGHVVSERKVATLMREDGLAARKKRKFRGTADSKQDGPIAPNLLERDFAADKKNESWVTDVTAIWTRSGWLFLAAILDLFSRRVVGWATSACNDRFLALDALRDALNRRGSVVGLIHHSDRGSPYASEDYRAELKRFGIIVSMSRKGDCWDNAVAESFFSTLKTELLGDSIPDSHDAGTASIKEYIECFYNTTRRHSYLGYVSPIEFELKRHITAIAA